MSTASSLAAYTSFTRALVSGPARAGSVSMVHALRTELSCAVPARLGISSRASAGWLGSSTLCLSETETLCLIQLRSDQDEQEV